MKDYKILFGKPPLINTQNKLEEIDFNSVFEIITKSERLKKLAFQFTAYNNKRERLEFKKTKLPFICTNELSEPFRKSEFFQKSKILGFEIDNIQEPDKLKFQLVKDEHIFFIYKSISGKGLKFFIQLSEYLTKVNYKRVYSVIAKKYEKKYNINIDFQNNELARVQLLGYDVKAVLKKNSKPYNITSILTILKNIDDVKNEYNKPLRGIDTNLEEIPKIIQHIRNNGYLNIKDEFLWFTFGMAFASLGETGRAFFIKLSNNHPLYPEDNEITLNRKFDKFLKQYGIYYDKNRLITINSFYKIASEKFGYKFKKRKKEKPSLELILSDLFYKEYKDILFFDHSKKNINYGWLIFDGYKYNVSQKGEITDLYLNFIKKIREKVLDKDEEMRELEIGINEICKAESRTYRDLVLKWVSEKPEVRSNIKEFDNLNNIICIKNCLLDIDSGKKIEPNNKLKITKQISIEYDKNNDCPKWKSFISKIFFNDEEIINYIQKSVGYSLTGFTSEQCLFFLYGIGANGKSTFLEALRYVFGDYAINSSYETFTNLQRGSNNHSEDLYRLKGSRFVISSEIASNKGLNESIIKQLTSGDTLTARTLHSESVEFQTTFKIWIAGNHKPKIHNFDYGIRRRIKIIPFNYTFKGDEIRPQYEVLKEFIEEAPGILNWAIEGIYKWKKDGGLQVPKIVEEATKEYFLENNSIAQFLDEYCIFNSIYKVEKSLLYKAFVEYTFKTNEYKLGRNNFYKKIIELGYKETKISNTKYFVGFDLKELPQEEKEKTPEDDLPF